MFIDFTGTESALRQEGHVRDQLSVLGLEGRHCPPAGGRVLCNASYKHGPPAGGRADCNRTL